VFFENLLLKKESATWSLFPEDQIKIKAETSQSKKAEREKSWEGKTMHVKGEDGVTREVPYAEGMNIFAGLFDNYFDLYISFDSTFFTGDVNGFEGYDVCLHLKLSFQTLEQFINELKAEYELFKLQMGPDERWN
jgi:hypothetical protein